MNIVSDFLPYLNVILAVGLVVGGIFAIKKGYSKESGEAQERLIDALEKEVTQVRREVADLQKDRAQQDRVLSTIRYALKQYGLRIIIQGDFVTINDASGKSKVVRIQDRAPVKPMVAGDDDDDSGVI